MPLKVKEGGGGNSTVREVVGAPWQRVHTPKGSAACRGPCETKYTHPRN